MMLFLSWLIFLYCREFDKTVECKKNVDPLSFGLIRNNACLTKENIGEEDIPSNVDSMTVSCEGNYIL